MTLILMQITEMTVLRKYTVALSITLQLLFLAHFFILIFFFKISLVIQVARDQNFFLFDDSIAFVGCNEPELSVLQIVFIDFIGCKKLQLFERILKTGKLTIILKNKIKKKSKIIFDYFNLLILIEQRKGLELFFHKTYMQLKKLITARYKPLLFM